MTVNLDYSETHIEPDHIKIFLISFYSDSLEQTRYFLNQNPALHGKNSVINVIHISTLSERPQKAKLSMKPFPFFQLLSAKRPNQICKLYK